MAKPDKMSDRFQKNQERKKLQDAVVSPDDAPVPDAPVEQAHTARKAGRNDPCPCGSGKKFKQCCGRSA